MLIEDGLFDCPVTPVRDRQQATQRHNQGAQPDPPHKRLVIKAYAPFAITQGLTQRNVQIAEQARIYA